MIPLAPESPSGDARTRPVWLCRVNTICGHQLHPKDPWQNIIRNWPADMYMTGWKKTAVPAQEPLLPGPAGAIEMLTSGPDCYAGYRPIAIACYPLPL
jgi:hypothetical protein